MKKLTEGNIYKNFILFAIPLVLSGILSSSFHMIDTAIAGRFLGEHGLAAIGATSSVITVLSAFISGYSTGFSIYIARLFGAGEYVKIKRGLYVHMILCVMVSVVFGGMLLLFHEPLFDLLQIEEALRADAFTYFAIYIGGFSFLILHTNLVFTMNALGISAFPFYMSVLSAVLNVVGNVVSIVVLKLGVGGVALSTVLSSAVVSVVLFVRLLFLFRKMGCAKKKFRWRLAETREGFSYAFPTMLQQVSMYLAGLVLAPLLNATGSAGIASYVVTSQILSFICTVFQSASRTVSNYSAQCMGSDYPVPEKKEKLRRGLRVGLLQGVAFTLPLLLICVIFPDVATQIFYSENAAGESVELALFFTRFLLPFCLFKLVDNLFHSFFRGTKAMHLLVMATVVASVVQILASYLLIPHFGINGYYGGMIISWIAEAILVFALYVSRVWMPREWRFYREETEISPS